MRKASGARSNKADAINPKHYREAPANRSGVECIDVVEHLSFNVGAAIKYCWRAGLKGDPVEDIRKAVWFLNREIQRLEKSNGR